MDILKKKTIIGVEGNTFINCGLNRSQILKISRQGEQKDYAGFVALTSLNGSNWTFYNPSRLSFGSDFRYVGGEIIHIIYKVSI